ncbi:MAG: hypothetical protein ACI8UO_004376 [Verrucomicrobiales bacterium]|jgi:hypothetical protein
MRAIFYLLAGFVLTGCFERVEEAEKEDLRGEWRVNLGRAPVVRAGAPIFAELRITNESKERLLLPTGVQPDLHGANVALLWTSLGTAPESVDPGESAVLAWQLQGVLRPGSYQISTLGGDLDFPASPCVLTLAQESANPAAIELYEDQVARLKGEVGDSIKRLQARVDSGEANPTDRFRLADLLASSGDSAAAQKQFAAFAKMVYGEGPYPAWLASKLDDSPTP